MTATATEITAALRHTIPGLTPGRIHRLLYLAQGHHLSWTRGEPLFEEPIVAWDTGVIVPAVRGRELDGQPGTGSLGNTALNAVNYIASRYGKLRHHDLDLLTRNSTPVLDADRGRNPGISVTIDRQAMVAYFASVDVDPDAPIISAERIAAHRAAAERNAGSATQPDDLDRIREWAAGLRAQAEPEAAARRA